MFETGISLSNDVVPTASSHSDTATRVFQDHAKLKYLEGEVRELRITQANLLRGLTALDGRLSSITGTTPSTGQASSKTSAYFPVPHFAEQFVERFAKIERGHKTLITSAQRALQTALDTQQQQRDLEAFVSAQFPTPAEKAAETIEARASSLASPSLVLELPSRTPEGSSPLSGLSPLATDSVARIESLSGVLQSVEARLDGGMRDLRARVVRLEGAIDEGTLPSTSLRLPDARSQIEGLTMQCQEMETRERELEVRVDALRTHVDNLNRRASATPASGRAHHREGHLCSGFLARLNDNRDGVDLDGAASLEAVSHKRAANLRRVNGQVDTQMEAISTLCKQLQ
jgi:hypothetical protein